ncbi:MAG: CARDB domain-containing protein, partial [Candidatus Bipolaricaulia bacterium]
YYEDKEGLRENEVMKAQGTLETADLPPGDYILRVVVDPDDHIPEPDEANNVISAPLVILPPEPRLAELHSTELVLDPPSPVRSGRTVRVTATIWNTGNIDAQRFQVELAYSQDGQSWMPFAVQDIPVLPRGGKEIVEGQLSTAGLSVGVTYGIRVLVDPRDEVAELDEGNNALVAALSLVTPAVPPAAGANLALQELLFNPPSPVGQGAQVQVCATIANTGQGAAGEFLVEFRYRQDQVGPFTSFASESVPGLEVGRSLTICELFNTAGLPRGTYEIEAVVDSGNWVAELDETDNELTRTLIISQAVPRPDLYPAGLSFNPPSPVAQGTQVQVCAKVTNDGPVAAGPFAISYAYRLDSYVQFATARASGLGGGEGIELCRALDTRGLATGTYEIKVVVDPEDRVAEGNETNNELTGYLTIGLPPTPTAQLALSTGGAVRLLRLDEGTGTVYIASEDGKLYALERGAGAKSGFPFDAGSPIRALVLDTGAPRAAYLGTAAGTFYAVALDRGREVCRAALEGEISALGVDKFGNIYIGTAAKLVSLTAACEPRWEFATVGAVRALAVDDPRDAIYAITSAGLLYALGRAGSPDWQLDLRSPLSALALGQAIYVGTEDGRVQSVTFGGRLGWSFTAGGAITAIVVDGEQDPIYAASADGRLYSLDTAGNLRWAFSTPGPRYSTPTIDGRTGALFLGSDEGKLYALNSDGTEIFTADVGSPIRSGPVIDVVVEREGAGVRLVRRVYFGTEGQNLYVIRVTL